MLSTIDCSPLTQTRTTEADTSQTKKWSLEAADIEKMAAKWTRREWLEWVAEPRCREVLYEAFHADIKIMVKNHDEKYGAIGNQSAGNSWSLANMAFLEMVHEFDPQRGATFGTFLDRLLPMRIIDEMRQQSGQSTWKSWQFKIIQAARDKVADRIGQNVPLEDPLVYQEVVSSRGFHNGNYRNLRSYQLFVSNHFYQRSVFNFTDMEIETGTRFDSPDTRNLSLPESSDDKREEDTVTVARAKTRSKPGSNRLLEAARGLTACELESVLSNLRAPEREIVRYAVREGQGSANCARALGYSYNLCQSASSNFRHALADMKSGRSVPQSIQHTSCNYPMGF